MSQATNVISTDAESKQYELTHRVNEKKDW